MEGGGEGGGGRAGGHGREGEAGERGVVGGKVRWEGWLGALLLHLADDIGGHGRVEVDGVVTEPLRSLVALPAAALEGFPHADLGSVAVLGVVLDPVHVLHRWEGGTREHRTFSGHWCSQRHQPDDIVRPSL